MKSRTITPAQTPEELLQDLRALVSEAEAMLGNSLTEHSAEAVASLRARYEATQERLAELYAGAKKKVVAGARYTDEAIREHPYQAIAIAAGVGLLVGVLLGRNSNNK
jgi:ElaB/YqjD/DUF883 family membrane-anchored ribosome-binding protein